MIEISKNILLVDVDSKISNLALMQISAYKKAQGHNVGFHVSDPDEVWVSCVFKKNGEQAKGIPKFYPNAEIHVGGSGVDYSWLPEEMQKIKPDYDLYLDMNYSLGFTTRGCIRKCPFCIVPKKEGKIQRWQHISKFHDDRFDTVMLLDNNWYADKEWFWENSQFLIDNDLKVDCTQGMDIRLLTPEIAERLRELKWAKILHFAFDSMKDEKWVRKGIEILKDVGFDIRHKVEFYVLVGFNSSVEEDKYRCRLLKELGTNAYVMPYIKNKWTSKIAWWANRKWAYWSCDIDEVDRGVKY